MSKEYSLLVVVETHNEDYLNTFAQKIYFDMDEPGVYVKSVKEIKQ